MKYVIHLRETPGARAPVIPLSSSLPREGILLIETFKSIRIARGARARAFRQFRGRSLHPKPRETGEVSGRLITVITWHVD